MVKSINHKINIIYSTGTVPNDINEVHSILDHLYIKASTLSETLEKDASILSNLYRYSLKQEKCVYQETDSMHVHAEKVDKLVNEYNNVLIMVELLEKKLSELEE